MNWRNRPGNVASTLLAGTLLLSTCQEPADRAASDSYSCEPVDPVAPHNPDSAVTDERVELLLSFSVPEPIYNDQFFVSPLEEGERPHFIYRSETTLHVYDPGGTRLWSAESANPQVDSPNALGTTHAAADVTGDGRMEVIALEDSGRIKIHEGSSGELLRTLSLPEPENEYAHWAHLAVVNLRGAGDRDAILQAVDRRGEGIHRYMNRTLLAWDLDDDRELWRVRQGAEPGDGVYEGYWGPAHGSFRTADIDGDGRDEVVGANLVDADGEVVDVGYPRSWVDVRDDGFVDHLDALAIGDFRSDHPGLEWVVTQEDHAGRSDYHVAMVSEEGVQWRVETDLFPEGGAREPQNIAVGRFDPERHRPRIWVRSRFPKPFLDSIETSQHPWILNELGERVADYRMVEALPAGFNQHENGNCEGLETIAPIQWIGGDVEHIAAKARHVDGEIGVFDAMTGEPVWYSPGHVPAMQAALLYVADVTDDGREEVVVYDAGGARIAVYGNPESGPETSAAGTWGDPNYRNLKQNWNYYSP